MSDPGLQPGARCRAGPAAGRRPRGDRGTLLVRNGEQLLLALVIPIGILVLGADPRRVRSATWPCSRRRCWPWRCGRRRSRRWRSRPGSSDATACWSGWPRPHWAAADCWPARPSASACSRRDRSSCCRWSPSRSAGGRPGRPPPCSSRCWPGCSRSACFGGLALLLAGRLRAEATLALANVVYVVGLAGGALVLPVARYPAAIQPVLELLPTAALGETLRAGAVGTVLLWPLVVLLVWTVGAGSRPGRGSDGRRDPSGAAGGRRRPALCAAGRSPAWWPTSSSWSPARLVRLTGSGLGCPTWPRCTADSYVTHPALGIHGAIEFGNRMLTFVLIVDRRTDLGQRDAAPTAKPDGCAG